VTLYAIDKLKGLVVAMALVRSSKSVMDMKAIFVKKKLKDKKFAAGIGKSMIEKGAEMVEIELTNLIADTIMAYGK